METSVTASSENHPSTLCSRIRTAARLGLSLFLLVALSWTVGTAAANTASSSLAYGDDDPARFVKASGTKAPLVLRPHGDKGPKGIKLPAPTVSDASSLFGTAATGSGSAVMSVPCVYCEKNVSPKANKVVTITIKYIGSGVTVDVVNDGNTYFDDLVLANGDEFTVDAADFGKSNLANDLDINDTGGSLLANFHLSCSQPLGVGQTGHAGPSATDFEVVTLTDLDLAVLCTEPPTEDLTCTDTSGTDAGNPGLISVSALVDNDSNGIPSVGDQYTFSVKICNEGNKTAEKAAGKLMEVTFYWPTHWFDGSGSVVLTSTKKSLKVGKCVEFEVTLTIKAVSSGLSATVFAEVSLDTIDDDDSAPDNLTITQNNTTFPFQLGVAGETGEDDFCQGSGLLPVELTTFEAVLDGRAAVLSWATASETNNAGFEIQRMAESDQGQWQVLGFIEGHGTTIEEQHYRYRIEDLDPGSHVFRLKQIDFDGTFEYSPQLEVTVEMPEMYFLSEVYPNPFNPEARLDFAVRQSQEVTVTAYNLLGQRVLELYSGVPAAGVTQSLMIDGSGLQSGMYVVRIQGERFVETRTFTLIK